MEVAGRRARLADGHVVAGAHLQEPLDARTGVVGPGALITVRQQQHDAPDFCVHFAKPEAMNSSRMIWPPLTKSPYWASQHTSASGAATE